MISFAWVWRKHVTYDVVLDAVDFGVCDVALETILDEGMLNAVDSQNSNFVECPASNFLGKRLVGGLGLFGI